MRDLYINPLSANSQCHTSEQVAQVVGDVLDCINHLWPAIQKEKIQLIYDKSIEERTFIYGQHLSSTISALPKNRDISRRWYLYTRNRPPRSDDRLEVTISAEQTPIHSLQGPIPSDVFNNEYNWLSFGNAPLHEASLLSLRHAEKQTTAKNAYHLESLKKLFPIFKPSDKHGQVAYKNARGEHVSPMTLSDENAQRLLLISTEDGGSRWAFLHEQNKYFCFKPTHNDLSEYHGFEVERDDIAPHLLKILHSIT